MKFFLEYILIIDSVLLVILVLLHSAKGDGFGSMGGDGKFFFPSRGLEDGLNRVTIVAATIFLSVSLCIGLM